MDEQPDRPRRASVRHRADNGLAAVWKCCRGLLLFPDPLPEDQRKDCIARMQGQGTTSGSVAGGGIYRELVTREPAAAASAPAVK